MSRAVGEFAAVARLPDAAVVVAAVATQLGDVWFLFGLLGLLYWFGEALPAPVALDRRRRVVGRHTVVRVLGRAVGIRPFGREPADRHPRGGLVGRILERRRGAPPAGPRFRVRAVRRRG